MTAKRAWITSAQCVLGLIIAIEIAWVILAMLYLIPKCQAIIIDADVGHRGLNAFMPGAGAIFAFLYAAKHFVLWWVVPLVIAWGFFERRVRGENKSHIRLLAMSSCTLLLLIVIGMMAAVMTIPTARAAEQYSSRQPEIIVRDRMAALDQLAGELDQAMAKKDWPVFLELSHTASGQAGNLVVTGASAPALLTLSEQTKVEKVRGQISDARAYLIDAWMASRVPDPARIESDMRNFHAVYDQLHRSAENGLR
jgi:hypothetical protein